MKLIQDFEFRSLIKAKTLLYVMGPDGVKGEAAVTVKGCTVDLTVGSIFVPGVEEAKLGSASIPRKELPLGQGQTAVVVTRETINFANNQAGIAFPPSGVSLKGLLTTNPGHIDPGYVGPLHLTVINMGRETYTLKEGDRILRLLVMELDGPSTTTPPRTGNGTNQIGAELLNRLSHDFVNVTARAESAAKAAIGQAQYRATLLQVLIPTLAAILGIFGTWYVATQKLEVRMGQVEALVPVVTRLDKLEKMNDVDERVKKIESKLKMK